MANELIIRVAANAKQAAQTFLGLRSDVRRSMTDVKKASSDAVTSIQQDAAKAAQSLQNVQQEAKETDQAFDSINPSDALGRLTAAIREMVQAFLGLSQEVKRAAAGIKSAMSDAADSVKQDAKEMEKALDNVQQEAKETEQTLQGIDWGSLGLAAAGGALLASVDSATASLGKLQAQLGITREEAQAFEEEMIKLYSQGLGQTFDDVHLAMMRVVQAVGYTADEAHEAAEVAADVIKIRDAFEHLGADIDMITENLRTMKATWPDLDEKEILDMIAESFQVGGGRAKDLQDTLQEYPRFFKDLGLTAKDMLLWLNIGLEKGAYNTDYLADALKEFGIRVKTAGDTGQEAIKKLFPEKEAKRIIKALSEGGEAGREAFYKVLEALSKVKDEHEKYNLAVQLFGTKAEDLGTVLTDEMIPALLQLKDETINTDDATSKLNTQYDNWQYKIEQVKRSIEGFIQTHFGQFAPALQDMTQLLSSVGITLLGLRGIGINVGGMLAGLWRGFQALGNILKTSVFPLLGRLGGLLLGGVWRGFLLFGNLLKANIFPLIARLGMLLLGLITGPAAPFVLIGTVVVGLGILIYKNWDKIKAWTQEKWGQVKNYLSTTWENLKASAAAKFENLKNAIAAKWEGAKTWTLTKWNQVKTYLANTWENLKASAAAKFEGLKNSVVSKWESLKERARSIFQQVKNFILAPFRNIRIPLPHFDFKVAWKSIAGIRFPVPDVDVRWYKTGGVFTKPIVPGFGDVEEAIVPFEGPHARRIAGLIAREMPDTLGRVIGEAIARAMSDTRTTTRNQPIVLNIDGRTVAQIIAPHVDKELARRQRISLRAQGVTT